MGTQFYGNIEPVLGYPKLQETAIYNYFPVHMLRIWKNEVQVKIWQQSKSLRISGWWFGTWLLFSIIYGNDNSIWLSYFSEGWVNHSTTNQIVIIVITVGNYSFIYLWVFHHNKLSLTIMNYHHVQLEIWQQIKPLRIFSPCILRNWKQTRWRSTSLRWDQIYAQHFAGNPSCLPGWSRWYPAWSTYQKAIENGDL